MCFRNRPTSSKEACSIKTQLPTQEVGETLGLTYCPPSPGSMCPASNLLQCPVPECAQKVDTCNSRSSLQTVLGSGPVQTPRSEGHQKSPVTVSTAPWPTCRMVWRGWCCMQSSCRLRSNTGIIQPCTILIDMGDDVWWFKTFYSPVSKPSYSLSPAGLVRYCKVALILSERSIFPCNQGKINSLNWTLCFAFVSVTERCC